jgi:hypothetical protein
MLRRRAKVRLELTGKLMTPDGPFEWRASVGHGGGKLADPEVFEKENWVSSSTSSWHNPDRSAYQFILWRNPSLEGARLVDRSLGVQCERILDTSGRTDDYDVRIIGLRVDAVSPEYWSDDEWPELEGYARHTRSVYEPLLARPIYSMASLGALIQRLAGDDRPHVGSGPTGAHCLTDPHAPFDR